MLKALIALLLINPLLLPANAPTPAQATPPSATSVAVTSTKKTGAPKTLWNEFTGVRNIAPVKGNAVSVGFEAEEHTPHSFSVIVDFRYAGETKWYADKRYQISSKDTAFYHHIPAETMTKNRDYRFRILGDANRAGWTSQTVAVRIVKQTPTLQAYAPTGSRVAPWVGQNARVHVSTPATVILQEKRGAKYVDVSSKKLNVGQHNYALPKGNSKSHSGAKMFRFRVAETFQQKAVWSNSFTQRWENPNYYTGSKKTMYNQYKKYCPNVLLEVKNLGGSALGYALLGSDVMQVSTRAKSNLWQSIVLHECAHFKQFQHYSKDWAGFQNRMNKIHKTGGQTGMERNATCIASKWAKPAVWTYGATARICSSGEPHKASWRLANGYRY